jgi:hypothetical protein
MHEINTYLLRESEGPTVLSTEVVENDSEFSRLISAAHIHSAPTRPVSWLADATSAFVDRSDEEVTYQSPLHIVSYDQNEKGFNLLLVGKYYFSAIAWSLMVLHLSFTLFSYSTETWSESVVLVRTSLQFIPVQRPLLYSYDLPTLFIRIKDASGVVAFTYLLLTTCLVPIVFMIFLPLWMFHSLKSRFLRSYRWTAIFNSFKRLLQLMIRWAMTLAFVQTVFVLNDLGITIPLSHSTVAIGTKISEGLSLYVFGISFAILCSSFLCLSDAFELSKACTDNSCMIKIESAADRPSVMYALEEKAYPVVLGATTSAESHTLQDNNQHVCRYAYLPFWKILLVSETGILSALLIVPSLCLTALHFEYNGTASVLMDSPNVALSIFQMPFSFYESSIAAGTVPWKITFLGIILISFSLICPLVALILAILTWFASPVSSSSSFWSRKRLKRYLNVIHPAVGGIVVSFALLALRRSVTKVDVERYLAKTTAHTPFIKGQLLYISGTCHLEIGYWMFFTQSILLEAFISFTNSWS